MFVTLLTLSLFISQAIAASTVRFCIEVSCSSMNLTFGGVTHPKTLNCENMLSFDGASAGTYSYSLSGCGLTSSGSVTVDGTSAYSITICPPSGWPCCPIGCGTDGDYKCSCSETTTTTTASTTTTSTSTTTTSTSNTTTTTLPTVQTEPTLTVTTSGTTVSLSWTSVAGATGYTLYYAPYPYTGPDSIADIPMGTQTSISASLWEGAAFYVAVQAYVSGKSSGYSNIEYFVIQNQTEPEFTVMTNPTDSQILSVKGIDGTTVHYYGDRDESGIPTNIDRLSVVDADGATTMIELDSESRPKEIRTSDGVVFQLSYVGSNQGVVTAVAPDGSLQVNTSFPIETGADSPSQVESMAGTGTSGDCYIYVENCGAAVTDADVSVEVYQPGDNWPSWSGPAKHNGGGKYYISIPTSLQPSLNSEDLRKAAENIAWGVGLICTGLGIADDPGQIINQARLLTAMCAEISLGLVTVTGPGSATIMSACMAASVAGLAYCTVAGNGGVPGAESFMENFVKGLQDPNILTGKLRIDVSVREPGSWFGHGIGATVTAPPEGPFPMITVSGSASHRIGRLTLSPVIPEGLEPYEITTQIVCPEEHDQPTIDIIRVDDRDVPIEYHWEFPPFPAGYGGGTVDVTKAFPGGGDFGPATDTVTAVLRDGYGKIVHQRSVIIEIPEAYKISGTWTGTFTMTDFEITDEAAAEEEGCTTLIAQQIVGKPLPMTIEITVDKKGRGTATMLIDVSSLGESANSEPQSFTVRQNGSAVTFESTGSTAYTMNATVTAGGTSLVMKGTTSVSGSGWKMNCAFTASKPR